MAGGMDVILGYEKSSKGAFSELRKRNQNLLQEEER